MKPPRIKIDGHWWRIHYQHDAQVRCELCHKQFYQKGIGVANRQQDALTNAIDNLREKLKGIRK